MYASTLSGSEALVVISDIFGMFLNLDHKLEGVPDEATCDFAETISHFYGQSVDKCFQMCGVEVVESRCGAVG
jgi:hypothetical protein